MLRLSITYFLGLKLLRRFKKADSAGSKSAISRNFSPHSSEKKGTDDAGIFLGAELLPQGIQPIAVVPRQDRNIRCESFLICYSLGLMFAKKDHGTRSQQTLFIRDVVMKLVSDSVRPKSAVLYRCRRIGCKSLDFSSS